MVLPGADDTLQVLAAAPGWRAIDFISDLHLAEDTPRTFAAWRDYLEHTPAEAVLILGDLFEVWVGDDSRSAGFEARAAQVLSAAAKRRMIGYMVGNRDFLVGPALLEACGLVALQDPTLVTAFGARIVVSHGDALCTGDVQYQRFRELVRDPAWQQAFLARPIGERRSIAREMRAASEDRRAASSSWHDVDSGAALELLRAAEARTLVHGHTHRPGSEILARCFERHVLSDWDLDHGTAGRAEVLRWSDSGFSRLSIEESLRPSA